MRPTRRLRELLAGDRIVMAGGAHDALSARLVQQVGFPLCVVTGAGLSMVRGYPDIGLMSLQEVVDAAAYIAEAVEIPVIVDADTGYGNAINVRRTVRAFERVGVAGIHIEDQDWPKRCGHMSGKRVIPAAEMAQKIRAACEARRDAEFVVIARSDALQVNGLADTLERGEEYLEAGADMLFFETRESLEEIRAMADRFRGRLPLLYNHSESGRVPRLPARELEAMGFKIVAFYGHALLAACKTMREILKEIREAGNSTSICQRLLAFEEFWEICDLSTIRRLENRYGG